MILVLLGTQDKQFPRLLKEIDRLIEKKVIKDKVIAQVGITKYNSNNMEMDNNYQEIDNVYFFYHKTKKNDKKSTFLKQVRKIRPI